MGKTNPTYRQLLDEWLQDWDHFQRALRRQDKGAFEDVKDGAKHYADAVGYANPIHSELDRYIYMSICLDQQRQLNQLQTELEEVKRLAGDLARHHRDNDPLELTDQQ